MIFAATPAKTEKTNDFMSDKAFTPFLLQNKGMATKIYYHNKILIAIIIKTISVASRDGLLVPTVAVEFKVARMADVLKKLTADALLFHR